MTEPAASHREIVEQLRAATAARDFAQLAPILAEDVRFGSCRGMPQVVQFLQHLAQHHATDIVDVDVLDDRVVAMLAFPPGQLEDDRVAVLFVRDERVEELQFSPDRAQALSATPTPAPLPWTGRPTRMTRLAPVLPVRDLSRALEHYRRLGFAVSAYSGGEYGYGERDGLNVHFCVVPDLDPMLTTSAVYLYVDDADALFAEWSASGISGQFHEPQDTEYGLREGAHVDLDGNLLRFGSSTAK
jgi:hypothetical protein